MDCSQLTCRPCKLLKDDKCFEEAQPDPRFIIFSCDSDY